MPRMIIVYIHRAISLHVPDSVFSSASLEELTMSLYSDGRTFIAPKSINLPSLKILELYSIELGDNFAQKLFWGCPALKSVKLQVGYICHFFQHAEDVGFTWMQAVSAIANFLPCSCFFVY